MKTEIHNGYTATLEFIKENFGHYKLSFFQLINQRIDFIYEDHIGYIKAEVSIDSTILTPQIDFNTPCINWQYIEVFIYEEDQVTVDWVTPNYKWS